MKKTILIALFFLILASIAFAIPPVSSYTGRITFLNGTILNETANFTFRIYNQSSGGALRWEENSSILVRDGLLAVYLGNNSDLNLPFDENYFLEVSVNGENLTPRSRFGVAAYSFRANNSDLLANRTSDYYLNATNTSIVQTFRQILTNFPLSGGGNLQSDRTLTFDNTSYTNLDTRQAADNASIVRTDRFNFITGGLNATGLINVTNLTVRTGLSLPSRSVISDYIDSLDQAKLSITLPIANTTGSFPQSRMSIEGIPIANTTGSFPQNRMSIENLPIDNTTGSFPQPRMSITLPYTNLTGVNTGWTTTATTVINDTAGIMVGIGTTNALEKLTVVGNQNLSGFLNVTDLILRRTFTGTIPQSSLSIESLPVANTTGAFPQSRISIESIPAANITAGTFGTGNYLITGNLNVSGLLNLTNLTVRGAINSLPSRSIVSDWIDSLNQNKISISLNAENITSGILAQARFPNRALTNETNTFSATQFVTGGVNASTFLNASQLQIADNLIFTDGTNVGIGTKSPVIDASRGIQIYTAGTGLRSGITLAGNQSGADEIVGRFAFCDVDTTNANCRGAALDGVWESDNSIAFRFVSGAGNERIRLTGSGLFGINDTTPDGILDVDVSGQADALVVRANASVRLGYYAGTGRDYACFDELGNLVRSDAAC